MRILAVIIDPGGVKKILRRLIKIGRPPPQRFTHFGQRERTAWLFDMRPEILLSG
jgi:hypothetical protein